MPVFEYLALDADGAERVGQVEAPDERAAAVQLREARIFALSIRDPAVSGRDESGLGRLAPRRYLRTSQGDLVFLFRQLALMLRAGHTVVQALEANREMAVKFQLRNALGRMRDLIDDGGSLSRALAAEKRVFPPMVSKLIEAGEKTGEIEEILERLAEDMERRLDIKRQLITALTYPGLVFLIAVVVSAALVGWVIPRFAVFLTSRGKELPGVTQFLLDLADWFQDWGAIFGGGLGLFVFALLAAYTTRAGKRVIDTLLLKIPVVGGTLRSAALGQAASMLSMQLRSGITLLQSLSITAGVIGNQAFADAFAQAGERILSGQPLSLTLRVKVMPPLVRHMAAIGERSGELDTVMQALGEYYRKDLQVRVKVMAAWVEPVMILIVGGMVGTVYLAFFQAALKVSTR
ncbi:type II secretory pathway, component PulF [Thioflavicoccus mobilis 8321]|uniref:General secretion pathway protein F n=1 Tax=Thioflavicoccus mobilis 8321 TaxID=765912 RepID=L0GVW4_9GAMM|nr:type II secretion system F family protein [Thioflavicoccus mobilis]AGA89490.1 type II secretory pathway, component PulF [Thioflavicoccus mobilis 8321]